MSIDSDQETATPNPQAKTNMSVRQKIHIGFGSLILLMVVSMGVTLFKLDHVSTVTTKVLEEHQPVERTFHRLVQDLNLATSLVSGYLLTDRHELKLEYEATEQGLLNQLSHAQRSAKNLSDIDVQQLERAKVLIGQYAELVDKLFEHNDNQTNNRGLILAQDTLNVSATQFLSTLNILLASEEFETNNPSTIQGYRKLQELRYVWVQMMNNLRLFITTQGAGRVSNFENYSQRADLLLAELAVMDLDVGFGEFEELLRLRKEYLSYLQPVFDIFESGNWRADAYVMKTEVRPVLDELKAIFSSISKDHMEKSQQASTSATAAHQQILVSTVVILLIGVGLGSLIAMRIIGGIVPPIQGLMNAARQVAAGDLNAEVMVTSGDEIGKLGDSFNAMIDDLRAAALNEQNFLDELQDLNQELEARVIARTQELDASETKIRAILHNIGEGIIVLDEDDRIESVNPAAQQIFQMNGQAVIGINSSVLIADEDVSRLTQNTEPQDDIGIFDSKNYRQPDEYLGRRFDGSTFPMEFVVTTTELNERRMRVCIVRDITARKEAETTLAKAQNQLLDAAHKSGMADMATGVLHNIGNILNSVNVAGEEILRATKASKVKGLVKASQLLQSHEDNMDKFLTMDERGRKLPEYFVKMGSVLNEEMRGINDEAKGLLEKTTMMKEVISTQQSYAGAGFHSESLDLAEMVDDALRIQDASLSKWGVKLTKNFASLPEISGQKSKLLQVITNLIKNAKEAMGNNDELNKPKELTIETGMRPDGQVYLRVKDNGCGIDESHLSKIFSHGFTTKQEGHGFGLHSSANAMTEMRGELKVESEGLQKGACFTLTIPVYSAKVA